MEMVSEHKNHIKTPKRTFLDRKHIGINSIKKNHSLRNILTFSAVALILGVVANGNYFGVFNNQNEDEKIITPLSDPLPIPDIIHTLYENCLGSGNVQYMIVKCPTDKGYVYETIFVTPYELATKFSKKFFSIRDISVNETFDGSILLQYQRSMYKTSYFEK